jgi:hypothetical protein
LAKIWQKFGKNLAKIWQKFGKNLAKIWQKYFIRNDKYSLNPKIESVPRAKSSLSMCLRVSPTGLPDFSWSKHTKMGKIYQTTENNT